MADFGPYDPERDARYTQERLALLIEKREAIQAQINWEIKSLPKRQERHKIE